MQVIYVRHLFLKNTTVLFEYMFLQLLLYQLLFKEFQRKTTLMVTFVLIYYVHMYKATVYHDTGDITAILKRRTN